MEKFIYDYPRPMLTVDCIIICNFQDTYKLLLIERGNEPYKGKYALPGGFVDMDEDLDEAVIREVSEETNLELNKAEQLFTIGTPGRDPRGRTVSVIYYSKIKIEEAQKTKAGDDAAQAKWFDIKNIPPLAFDHNYIVEKALKIIESDINS